MDLIPIVRLLLEIALVIKAFRVDERVLEWYRRRTREPDVWVEFL